MPYTILITGEELMTNGNWYNSHFFQKLSNVKKRNPKCTKTFKQMAAKGTKSAHVALRGSVGLAESTWVSEAVVADALRPLQVKQDPGEAAATDSFTPVQSNCNYL